jgi:hypothetical protein
MAGAAKDTVARKAVTVEMASTFGKALLPAWREIRTSCVIGLCGLVDTWFVFPRECIYDGQRQAVGSTTSQARHPFRARS